MRTEQTNEELVLAFLTDAGDDFVSGEVLLGKLGLTKKNLFHSVESLRSKGYRIEAGHHGYRLVEVPDRLSALELQPLLSTRELGRQVHYAETVTSTMKVAEQLADEGAPHGQAVIAENQTEGRGRRGRTWVSPPGLNLSLSLVLRPSLPPSRAPELTLVAAVALADTLIDAGVDAKVKWPNDVEVGGRKLAGILTELSATPERINAVILGIGVNLNATAKDFPDELQGTATSVRVVRKSPVPRALFAAALLAQLEAWLDRHEDEGMPPVLARLREISSTIGAKVKVRLESKELVGVATDMDETGALLVKTDAGVERIVAGDVENLRPS